MIPVQTECFRTHFWSCGGIRLKHVHFVYKHGLGDCWREILHDQIAKIYWRHRQSFFRGIQEVGNKEKHDFGAMRSP